MLRMEETRPSGNISGDTPITLRPGQVAFRLLCHTTTAGGVIGRSGTIVKRIQFETGATIRIEDTIPNCHERLINVIGYPAIDKRIRFKGFREECEVSQAQEALIRVFERVLEVEGTGFGVIGCRLLGSTGDVGAIMGKGGKSVDKIRKSTGAKIRVLPRAHLPACASPADEVIQVMGGVVAVKKALVAVAQRLQYKAQMEIKMLKLEEEKTRRRVVFRLLCPVVTAGGVIGKGASYVKALENETGACIKLAASVAWAKERVATISAFENPGPLYSPAQVATVRVFDRSVDISVEMGLVSITGNGDPVSARLLLSSKDVACLCDDENKVASDISFASGVEMQLLAGDHALHCAADFDKVLQITGAYANVNSALFQVTGRLRDNMFSSISLYKEMTLKKELDFLGFSDKDESQSSPNLQHIEVNIL